MPGFLAGVNIKMVESIDSKALIINRSVTDEYFIEQRAVNKFASDKIFYEDESTHILFDGVFLNKNELTKLNGNEDWSQVIKRLFKEKGSNFVKELSGSFSGLIYDKALRKWFVFSDHIGSKPVYYFQGNDKILISSDVDYIVEVLKENNIACTLNITSAYCILSYGYVLENNTIINEIKRLNPGSYLVIENSKLSVTEYFRFTNNPNFSISERDHIELMDYHFRKAVKMQFEKDLEYNYRHLAGLSSGLDSRMTTWVANDLGYRDIVNFTFSQTDYFDEYVPKRIAADLKNEWIFKSLDNGIFLKDIDEYPRISGGNVLYSGLAHGTSLCRLLNFDKLGLIHSGQLGDVVFGTFYSLPKHGVKHKLGDGAYSKTLLNRLDGVVFSDYENQEIFNFYNRGFRGANLGLLAVNQYTETFSPFYNVDLLSYALTIPVELRFNHAIYKKWILSKYPKAANYVWGKAGAKITDPQIVFKGRSIYLNKIPSKIKNRINKSLGRKVDGTISRAHMNPLAYWLKTNNELNSLFTKYYNDNIDLVNDKNLKADCLYLYGKGNAIEKIAVLSLLSSIKYFQLK